MLLTMLFSILTASPASLSQQTACPLSEPVTHVAAFDRQDSAHLDAFSRPTHKLRKLHLVRPDLLPFPINTSTYC